MYYIFKYEIFLLLKRSYFLDPIKCLYLKVIIKFKNYSEDVSLACIVSVLQIYKIIKTISYRQQLLGLKSK